MASLDLLEHYKLTTPSQTSETTVHTFTEPDPERRRRRVEVKQEWSRVRRLGIGGFGVVFLEKEAERGQLRAVKKVTKSMNERDEFESLRELISITIFSKDKTNFPTFYGWFDDSEHIYMAMEYFEHGDLYQCLTSGKEPLPERQAQSICFQLAEALEVIHERSITHRDLKPNNIFVVRKGPQWWVKLGDFGISKRVQNQDTSLHTMYIGAYVAPEILGLVSVDADMPTPYTSAVDIWSLGCLAYWILTLKVLFEPAVLRPYCLEGKLPESLQDSSLIPSGARDFIKRCVDLEARKRPSATDALELPWLNYYDNEEEADNKEEEDKEKSKDQTEISGSKELPRAETSERERVLSRAKLRSPERPAAPHIRPIADNWREVEGRFFGAVSDYNLPDRENFDPLCMTIEADERIVVLGEGPDRRIIVRKSGEVGLVPRYVVHSPHWDFGDKQMARVVQISGNFITASTLDGETKYFAISDLNHASVRWVTRWLGMVMPTLRALGATYDPIKHALMPGNREWVSFRAFQKVKPTARFLRYEDEIVHIISADGKERSYPIEWLTYESLDQNLYKEFMKMPEMILQNRFVLGAIESKDCVFGKPLANWKRDDAEDLLLTAGKVIRGFTEKEIILENAVHRLWELKYRDLQIVAAAVKNLIDKVRAFQDSKPKENCFGAMVRWNSSHEVPPNPQIFISLTRIIDIRSQVIWHEQDYNAKCSKITDIRRSLLQAIQEVINPEEQRKLNPFRTWDLSGISKITAFKRAATDVEKKVASSDSI